MPCNSGLLLVGVNTHPITCHAPLTDDTRKPGNFHSVELPPTQVPSACSHTTQRTAIPTGGEERAAANQSCGTTRAKEANLAPRAVVVVVLLAVVIPHNVA